MTSHTQVAVFAALATVAAGVIVTVIVLRKRRDPEKRERERRLRIHREGRLGDAMITEATEDALYYTYSVRGVQYTASQDIATLRDRLPADPEKLVGVASLKYSSNNPANSILICEEWSGLRAPSQAA
jgi:hypothetical protein